ncbi:proteinase inhibitor I3 [Tanacetum coccineum]
MIPSLFYVTFVLLITAASAAQKVVRDATGEKDPKDEVGGQFMFVLTGTKREKYLKTSLVLGITSGVTKSACDKSIFWTIDTPEAKPPLNLITLGGRLEEDFTCFQLLEYPKPTNPKVHSYKLQNCPLFCGVPGYNQTCFNVSIYVDNGVRHLATDPCDQIVAPS